LTLHGVQLSYIVYVDVNLVLIFIGESLHPGIVLRFDGNPVQGP